MASKLFFLNYDFFTFLFILLKKEIPDMLCNHTLDEKASEIAL